MTLSTTETAKTEQTFIGIDHGKDDHSVEVVGRLRADGSIEVIGFRHIAPKKRQGASK
jgi:hypothetical protein